MEKIKIQRLLKQIDAAYGKAESLESDLVKMVQDKTDFDIHVTRVGGDGTVFGDLYGNVVPPMSVFDHLRKEEFLSHEDFKRMAI
jgi:hypothetical protein